MMCATLDLWLQFNFRHRAEEVIARSYGNVIWHKVSLPWQNLKMEDPSDIVDKKIDNEIEKSTVLNDSSDDDSSLSSESDSSRTSWSKGE